jgi:hypothetical protein
MPLSGKKNIAQRAAGRADLVPYLHLSDESAGFLQLAQTIATWFQYVDDEEVRNSANGVIDLLIKQHWNRSHDKCIELVDLAIAKGLRSCFLIDRIQFLDAFSLSLIRECLRDKTVQRRISHRGSDRRMITPINESFHSIHPGKLCFLCVRLAFYNAKSMSDIIDELSRSNEALEIPVLRVGEAGREELRTMFRDLSDMEVDDRWLDANSEACCNACGYFIERVAAIRNKSSKLWSEGKRPYAETSERLVLHIPYGLVRKNKTIPVMEISAEVAMRCHQMFDELPPISQTTLKVLAVACRSTFVNHLSRQVLWEVLNDLVADGVIWDVLTTILEEIADVYMIKADTIDDQDVVSLQCPAFGDVAYDVSTPDQIKIIAVALSEQLQPHVDDDFTVPFLLANLNQIIGNICTDSRDYWLKGYEMMLKRSSGWTEREINKWNECLFDEIASTGCNAKEILGIQSNFDQMNVKTVGKILPLLKVRAGAVHWISD